MENKLGDELYGESLQLKKLELRSAIADEQQNSLNGQNLPAWMNLYEIPVIKFIQWYRLVNAKGFHND